MARIDTIEALRRRGISKKTAEMLTDAGFTVESLKTATPERVSKYVSAKEAKKVLAKMGAKEEPRKREPKAGKPAAEAEEGAAEAEEAPAAPPKIPDKVPKSSDQEDGITGILAGLGIALPRQVV